MQTLSGKEISRIGIGSYGIGGFGHRDMDIADKKEDEKYIDALVHNLNKGINFIETSMGYAHGQSVALFKRALDQSSVNREDVFITHSLYPRDLSNPEVMNEDIADFYEVMATDYADSTLVTQGLIMQIGEERTYALLHDLLNSGKTRYVSLSNASPKWVATFKEEFGEKFYAHEGHISFEIRAVQDLGVFKTCDELGVKNIIWRPLGQNRTAKHNWPLLIELSEKYHKTQNQVILNWICHLGYSPMVMSTNPSHIDENLASLDFTMDDEDYERISSFRPDHYEPSTVRWEEASGGDELVTLVNDFEKQLVEL